MDIEKKDRLGSYLMPHLSEMVFDELSESYLEKAGIKDILLDIPVPIKKTEMNNISVLSIALNMAHVFGCDPGFKYRENYIEYILRNFDKRFAEGLIAQGVEMSQKEDFDNAVIKFRAALQIDPDNANAYYCYGRACKDSYERLDDEDLIGRFKAEALEAFEVATIKNSELAEAYYFLGYAYLNMGLYVKAKLTWQEYLNIIEKKYAGNAVSSLTGKESDELKKTIEEITERLTQLEEPVKIEEGYNLVVSGKFEEGIKVLEPYKESDFKTWWPLYHYLGTAYQEIGNLDEAEKCYLEVLKLSPSNQDTMENLIKIYEETDNKEKIEKYKNKLKIVQENVELDREEKSKTKLN